MDSWEINKMYNSYTITVFKYIHTIPYIKVYVQEKKKYKTTAPWLH